MDLGRAAELVKKYSVLLAGLVGVMGGAVLGAAVGYYQRSDVGSKDYSSVSAGGDDAEIVASNSGVRGECVEGGWVEVEGAVVTPGVHCLPYESIVNDAIDAAGGINEDACVSWISRNVNRAAYVEPNSKLYLPYTTDDECVGINSNVTDSSRIIAAESSSGYCADGKTSINNASSSELESITGIGPSTAEKIIQGRPYNTVEDIMNVSGIGEKTYEGMEGEICL